MAKDSSAADSAASSYEENTRRLTGLANRLDKLIRSGNVTKIIKFASSLDRVPDEDAYFVIASRREGKQAAIENAIATRDPEILRPILSCIRGEEQINDFMSYMSENFNSAILNNDIETINIFVESLNETLHPEFFYKMLTSRIEGKKSPIENALDKGNPEILRPILSCIKGEERIYDFMSYVTRENVRLVYPLLSNKFKSDMDKVEPKLTKELLDTIIPLIAEGKEDEALPSLNDILLKTPQWYELLNTKPEDGKSPLNHILEQKQSKLMGAIVNSMTSDVELRDLLSEGKTTREEKLFIIDSCISRTDRKHVLGCLPKKDILEFSLGKEGPKKIESLKTQIQTYAQTKKKEDLEGIKEKMEEISGAVEYSTSKTLNYRENVNLVAKHIGSIFREASGSTEDLTTKQKLSNVFQSFCESLGIRTERQKAKELFHSSDMFAGIREALTKNASDSHTPPPPSAAAVARGKGGAAGHSL